jgi:ABC-type Fe3+ transport system permease subunit
MTTQSVPTSAQSMLRPKPLSLIVGLIALCAVIGACQELGVLGIIDGALQSHGHLYNTVFPCFLYLSMISFFLRAASGRWKSIWATLMYGVGAGYVAGLLSLGVVALSSGRPWFEWRFLGATLVVTLATLSWLMGLGVSLMYRFLTRHTECTEQAEPASRRL